MKQTGRAVGGAERRRERTAGRIGPGAGKGVLGVILGDISLVRS